MKFTEIFSKQDLEYNLNMGLVRKKFNERGDLYILNYTESTQFSRKWNDVTLNCRGLILDINDNVVARPYRKFFNYNEDLGREVKLDFNRVEIMDKADGSLGVMYKDPIDKCMKFSTRGSFDSEQAVHATKIYYERYHRTSTPDPQMTYLFEIIYPENRIVVDYKDLDDLILLGAVDIETGRYLTVEEAAFSLNWKGKRCKTFELSSLEDCVKLQRNNAEGLVIKTRTDLIKIKQEDYVELHRIRSNFTEKAIFEQFSSEVSLIDLINSLPDDFHRQTEEWYTKFQTEFDRVKGLSLAVFDEINVKDVSRKDFAVAVQTEFPGEMSLYRPVQFALLDGKPINKLIYRVIKNEYSL